MAEYIRIVTPENVELSYELAGLGSRFLAALIDIGIQIGCSFVVIVGAVGVATGGMTAGLDVTPLGPWGLGVVIILLFLIFWGYYVFFEMKWNGQTPGKRTVGLRVIRDGGHPIDFRAAVIRNLVRYADFFPSLYALGVAFIFFSKQHKRLGDYAAGTVVIKERGQEDTLAPVVIEHAPIILLDETMQLNLGRLTLDDYHALRHFLDRRAELAPGLALDLARRLAAPLLVKLGRNPNTMPADAVTLLDEIARAFEARNRR